MKKQIKTLLKRSFLMVYFSYPLFCLSQTRLSDLEYLKIGEIELSNDTLFLWKEIRPMLDRMDTARGTYHKLALSNNEKAKFLKLIERLNLLNLKSNNKQKQGYLPFEINYKIKGKKQSISAYEPGMSAAESENFKEYLATVYDIIDLTKTDERLLRTIADGQYQLKSTRRYQFKIGPSGWRSWEKKDGELKRIGIPLIFADGKEKDPSFIDRINRKKIKSFKVLQTHEADSLYGAKAKNGVIIISTK